DFGSPTVGQIFAVDEAARGIQSGGTHDYLNGRTGEPQHIDVWSTSSRKNLERPIGAGTLILIPGNSSGSEFAIDRAIVSRTIDLLIRLDEEFDLCIVDLSAGRSFATELALQATAHFSLRSITTRWLVFHRWTQQHIMAASSLVYGDHGLIEL